MNIFSLAYRAECSVQWNALSHQNAYERTYVNVKLNQSPELSSKEEKARAKL